MFEVESMSDNTSLPQGYAAWTAVHARDKSKDPRLSQTEAGEATSYGPA